MSYLVNERIITTADKETPQNNKSCLERKKPVIYMRKIIKSMTPSQK